MTLSKKTLGWLSLLFLCPAFINIYFLIATSESPINSAMSLVFNALISLAFIAPYFIVKKKNWGQKERFKKINQQILGILALGVTLLISSTVLILSLTEGAPGTFSSPVPDMVGYALIASLTISIVLFIAYFLKKDDENKP